MNKKLWTCKDEPRMFYTYVNGKMMNKKGLNKLKTNGMHVEEEAEIAEVLNYYFQSILTEEGTFNRPSKLDWQM